MHHEVTTASEPPEIVLQWIAQLLDPRFVAMIRAIPYDKVDVRLSAAKGKVREPSISVNCDFRHA